ncbi:condensation domain-containing protein, partial [Sinomicrobium oceani]|uniref:condensation domain-containing protein n=1 Tax=Sinomicrobium oceani TaxID=1150368 RepID=UPI00227A565C
SGGNKTLKVSLRNAIEKVDYPLNLLAYEHNGSLSFQLRYDGAYLTPSKAEQLLKTLEAILDQAVKAPERSHNQISLLSQEEHHKMVYQ